MISFCKGATPPEASWNALRAPRARFSACIAIAPFSKETYRLNLSPVERTGFDADIESQSHCGACWVGTPTLDALLGGWFEGKMLAAACRLYEMGPSVAVLPALIVLEQAKEADEYFTPFVLKCDYLFIPDFQVDAGMGWRSPTSELFKLTALVQKRVQAKKRTFIGVQNHNKLPPEVRNFLFGKLRVREIDPAAQVPHPDREAVHAEIKTVLEAQGLEHMPNMEPVKRRREPTRDEENEVERLICEQPTPNSQYREED